MCLSHVLAKDRTSSLDPGKSVSEKVDDVWRIIETEGKAPLENETETAVIAAMVVSEEPPVAVKGEASIPEVKPEDHSK